MHLFNQIYRTFKIIIVPLCYRFDVLIFLVNSTAIAQLIPKDSI